MIWDYLKEHLNSPVPDATSVFLITMWPITAQAIRKAKKSAALSHFVDVWPAARRERFSGGELQPTSPSTEHIYSRHQQQSRWNAPGSPLLPASRCLHNIKHHLSFSSENETPLIHLDRVLFRPRSDPTKTPPPSHLLHGSFQLGPFSAP